MTRASTISARVRELAHARPDDLAFVEHASGARMTWGEYDERADACARALAARHERGARVAFTMTDGPEVHAAYVGAERAGVVGVGIGPRANEREVAHLVTTTGASEVVRTLPSAADGRALAGRTAIDADELWFLNSTSGTTGLPKCVMHHQRRWFAFHEFAQAAARFTSDDVCCSLLPSPFGFGLWTAHFTPAIVGAPCVLLERFSPAAAIAALAAHRVTVLAAVSTQFIMMLNAPELDDHDLSALRVMFTGGEMVPYDRALEWEERTGSRVLQFYGSNETGALSGTSLADDVETRLRTAGHVIPEMQVRLLDPDTGADVTRTGGPGIAACRGPVTCLGYYDDPEANAQLVTADGWMRTGDLCTIDADGVLTVAGRASDFIIRGGKNISAAQVEDEVSTYPGVLLAAAVAMPDPVFGERVCVFCAVTPGVTFALDDLCAHLASRDFAKALWPERLVLVEGDLPRSSGGKVAKSDLRHRARSLPS